MTPLEYSIIPQEVKSIGVYIDGFHVLLENKIFVKESKIFLPLEEVISHIDNEIGLVDYKGYVKRSRKGVVFLEASYFENELGVSIAWEGSTHSLYVASDYHYDGYRKAPQDIFNKTINKYNNMYMYIDGTLTNTIDRMAYISTDEGTIRLYGYIERIEFNKKYRFCFSYKTEYSVNGVPVGRLMELVEPTNEYRYGFMYYTQSSWEKAEENKKKMSLSDRVSFIDNKQNNINERKNHPQNHSGWIVPEKKGKGTIGEFAYVPTVNWRCIENEIPRIGYYYYPYKNQTDGMVWISCVENKSGMSGKQFPFEAYSSGFFGLDNIFDTMDALVDGYYAKKEHFIKNISAGIFEGFAIIFATDAYIYNFVFSEKDFISENMLAYMDEFIDDVHVLVNGESKIAEEYYQKGRTYHRGDGVERNYKLAAQWYEKAVALGHANASNNLGVLLLNSTEAKQNIDRAIELLLYAGEQGDYVAYNNLGRLYRDGEYIKKDVNKAYNLFKKADEGDDGDGAFLIALMYQDGDLTLNYSTANEWFRKSLGKGFPLAALKLGMNLKEGKGEKKNYKLAKSYFDIATVCEDKTVSSAALGQIALLYLEGNGVEQNIELAKEYCLKSVEYKTAEGCYAAGKFFEDSRIANYEESQKWYMLAVSLGSENARLKLNNSDCYSNAFKSVKDQLDIMKQYKKI